MPTDIGPVDDAIEGAQKGGSKAKGALSKRIGPLPVWGWGVAVVGGAFIGYQLLRRRGASGGAAQPQPLPLASRPSGGGGVTGGSASGTAAPAPSPVAPSSSTPIIAPPMPQPNSAAVATRAQSIPLPQTVQSNWLPQDILRVPAGGVLTFPNGDVEVSQPKYLPGAERPITYGDNITQAWSFSGPNAAEDVGVAYQAYLQEHGGSAGGASL